MKIVMDRASAIGATQEVATAAGLLDERLGGSLGQLNALFANLRSVVDSADTAPTTQSYEVLRVLSAPLDKQLSKFNEVLQKDVPVLYDIVRQRGIPASVIKK